jgi:hypothetical protein
MTEALRHCGCCEADQVYFFAIFWTISMTASLYQWQRDTTKADMV